MPNPNQPQTVVTVPTKSVGISLILTFFFGPLGMLYSTVIGGVIMMVIAGILALITLPFGGFGGLFVWPICMIWGAVAANSHNRKLMRGRI